MVASRLLVLAELIIDGGVPLACLAGLIINGGVPLACVGRVNS